MRNWLVSIRKEKGMRQKDVAYAAGISQPFLHDIELGNRNPSVSTAKRIAAALGFDWTEFFSAEQRDAG